MTFVLLAGCKNPSSGFTADASSSGVTVGPNAATGSGSAAVPLPRGGSLIAFVSPSTENQSIHLVAPNGSGNTTLWSVPTGTPKGEGIQTLSWRPDGRALTFDSGHEAHRSMAIQDLFTISLSGEPPLRPSSRPETTLFPTLPKGSVTLHSDFCCKSSDVEVYVSGASAPVGWLASNAGYNTTFPKVADFGPNVKQYARLINLNEGTCVYDRAAFADVKPGTTVSAGRLTSQYTTSCVYVHAPSWRADGESITALVEEPIDTLFRSKHPWSNLWKFLPAGPPNQEGNRLADYSAMTISRNYAYTVAMNPNVSRANQFLLLTYETSASNMLLGDVTVPEHIDALPLSCPVYHTCTIMGVAWLPTGNAFYLSRYEHNLNGQANSVLYHYDVVSRKASPVLALPNEVIGRIAASPDGRTVVFERAHYPQNGPERFFRGDSALCPCSLWLVNSDGSGLRSLVNDGRAPAWSRTY